MIYTTDYYVWDYEFLLQYDLSIDLHRWLRLLYPRRYWGLRWSWMALTICYGRRRSPYSL